MIETIFQILQAIQKHKAPAHVKTDRMFIEGSWPRVSIIVPASRLTRAAQTLKAVGRQHYAGQYETIVVGPPAQILARSWPIIPINPGPIREPGRARNLGAAHANGEILLFLDDDVTVDEDWITHNVQYLQQTRMGIVGARISGKSQTFFAQCVDFTNFGHYQHKQGRDGPVASASMGVYKNVFQKVGGFDEQLCSSEDIDFCYRVRKQGYRSRYQPEIVVTHDHQRDTFGHLLGYNYAHGLASGLTTRIRHSEKGVMLYLWRCLCFPVFFLLSLPVIATLTTLRILILNIYDNPQVIRYIPFIWLGKLAYGLGIFRHLLQEYRNRRNRYVA